MTRDRAVTLGALALLAALSWLYLVRAPGHAHETMAVAAAAPAAAPAAEASHPPPADPAAGDDEEDDGVPRFP